MQTLKYVGVFILGFLIAKFWYDRKEVNHKREEIQVMLNGVRGMSKLVVSEGSFSEIFNYSDSKKYFYDFLTFDKKAIIAVNAKVEVGYDLSKLDIQIDSIARKIIINKIPLEEVTISPDLKYFDLQQSQFNPFTKSELNKINKRSIAKIKETIEVSTLKTEAKDRLFEELSKLYQLSATFNWELVDNTEQNLLENLSLFKN
ncbi:DUF4230 domain-containing protein [Tenacibaculum sp.]|nr:DUF4230 domain-containing protein [Tenacibaculum sp.]